MHVNKLCEAHKTFSKQEHFVKRYAKVLTIPATLDKQTGTRQIQELYTKRKNTLNL